MYYYEIGIINWDGFENVCLYKYSKELCMNDCVIVNYSNKDRVGVIIRDYPKPNFKCKNIKEKIL